MQDHAARQRSGSLGVARAIGAAKTGRPRSWLRSGPRLTRERKPVKLGSSFARRFQITKQCLGAQRPHSPVDRPGANSANARLEGPADAGMNMFTNAGGQIMENRRGRWTTEVPLDATHDYQLGTEGLTKKSLEALVAPSPSQPIVGNAAENREVDCDLPVSFGG